MKRIAKTAALLIVCMTARLSIAWWDTGHEVVTLIAWNDLTPAARSGVIKLLRAHPDFSATLTKEATPESEKDREAFLTASIWPDLIKAPGNRSIKYNHPVWHYVDFPFVVGDLKPDPSPPDTKWEPGKEPVNAAQAFTKCMGELANEKLTDSERGIALSWIEHLTGDIHQPLHAAAWFSTSLPQGDQGGNLLIVRVGDRVTNLHALWDGILGGAQPIETVQTLANGIAKSHPRKEFEEQLAAQDFESWAKASFELAKKDVYLNGKLAWITRDEQSRDRSRPAPEVPPGYMDNAKSVAERNIALAGYRLADILNKTFIDPKEK